MYHTLLDMPIGNNKTEKRRSIMSPSLIQKAIKSLPANTTEKQKTLLSVLCDHMSEEDEEHFDAELLAEVSKTHWELADERTSGSPKLKIYSTAGISDGPRKTIIDIVSDDLAFLVDSVVAEVNKNSFLIDFLLHPILNIEYDDKGNIKDVSEDSSKKTIRQSHIHIQIKDSPSKAALEKLEKGLYVALEDVYVANQDWQAMLGKLAEARDDLANAKTRRPLNEVQQYCDFLDYLQDNFTLLGYREYEFVEKNNDLTSKTKKGASLGLLHDDIRPAYISESEEGLPRNLQEKRRNLPPLSISKTNRLSTVHRRVPMDAIAIKTYDKDGNITGEKLFLGLFTSVTYSRSVSDVPYLREKVEEVLEMSNLREGSHDRKALRHILEKYPRDELFQIQIKQLYKIAKNILKLQERQRIALFIRKDEFRRYISCLVFVPRDRYGTSLRKRMAKILEAELNGTCENFYTSLDDSVFARVMFTINISQDNEMNYDALEIERKLQIAGQTWHEVLQQALYDAYQDEGNITSLTERYAEAFPISYTTRYRAKQAIFDIEKIEKVLEDRLLELDLYKPENAEENQLRLKVYNPDTPLNLSDVMPILQNLGLRAIAELPFEVLPKDAKRTVWIHDFLLEKEDTNQKVDIKKSKADFEKGFTKIWFKSMENDGLNRLILSANTNWHEITILRTYVRYLKQIRFPFSRPYIEKALNNNPSISRLLIDLFKAYHHPENGDKADKIADELHADITKALEKVDSLDEDRILRMIATLITATLRTNYYQRQENGSAKTYLSIKLDPSQIPEVPAPKPYREIFVYSPRMEGVHLRGDKIARGGLRWSDRHEDFRTEVLGLMKAQMVKNSVIVPMGAKGGFVVKTPTHSREEFMAEGIECYKTLIRGLLDITDNRKGEKIIKPQNVVCRDGDDPYLVVAADKGTASFSDIANGISEEYGHWLGDAFASGGSAGYDHKKMGITARGAWESVKLLFRELNHNIQEQNFDVIGVGDMGGDVFGNGMLLSKHICLVGAFNHLHIFCDPEPDPASSFKERKRLFDGVKGWGEYNEKLLSKGGRIFDRSEKTLKLTPEIQKRFDIAKTEVTPNELMRAMIGARTDLLWFGGIGTYIKSAGETNADVGDKANDGIRLNGDEVRAKVIGEGANLGVTQLGRIQFAEKGGLINTDFVDNSGGVNSSDLEVNIKILLSDVMSAKNNTMDIKERNKLLEKMTDDVADLVLRNNYQQAQAISLAELQAKENLQIQEEFIKDLEREKGLNRKLEGLPDEEKIESRMRIGKGLTRPELSILVSYAKIGFTQDLMATDIPESPDMEDWIINYFPDDLRKKYEKQIKNHRLAREIVATSMANSLINRMGPTFLKEKMKKTGASAAQIAKAYIIVRDAYALRSLWDQIEGLDNKVPAEVQLKAMREIARLSEHAVTWFLTRLGRDLDIGKDIEDFGKGIEKLRGNMDALFTPGLAETVRLRAAAGERDGLPKALAEQIALMPVLSSACDIIRISLEQKSDLIETAHTYFEVGEQFHMAWLRQQARFLPTEDHWQAEATLGLVDQLFSCQASLTVRILRDVKNSKNGHTPAEKWLDTHKDQIKQLDPLFADLRRAGTIDLPMLIIAEQRLRGLAGV
jgi:glutamate dehydrogenase